MHPGLRLSERNPRQPELRDWCGSTVIKPVQQNEPYLAWHPAHIADLIDALGTARKPPFRIKG